MYIKQVSGVFRPLLSGWSAKLTYCPIPSTVWDHKVHTKINSTIFDFDWYTLDFIVSLTIITLENVYSKRASIGYWFLNYWNYLHHMWMPCSNQWGKYQNISKICDKLFNDVDNLIFQVILIATNHETYVMKYLAWGIFTGMVMIFSGIVFVLSSKNPSLKHL